MQEIESAVRDLGGSAMQGIDHAVKGLNSGTLEGTLPFTRLLLHFFPRKPI